MTEQHIAGTIGILGAGWLGLPLARALLKAREGDVVWFRGPDGEEEIEILEVRYERIG